MWILNLKKQIGLLFFIIVLIAVSCQKERTEKPVPEDEKVKTVCIWDKAALRAEPSRDGSWLSSISLGEMVKYLGKSYVDTTDKNREYMMVELSDSTVGWAVSYVLVPDAFAGVIREETQIYRRPDLLTMTDDRFEMMDMVAVQSEKEDWAKIVGENRKKKGWIPKDRLITDKKEVTVAILASKALRMKDDIPIRQKIRKIIRESSFPDSYFIGQLKKRIESESDHEHN